jgi:HAE1 family hydrophobic/amphiphilic exporter-1
VNSTLSETDSETQKVEALIAGVSGITSYQATVGGQGGPFAGAAPADPSQASVLVLVQNGQYDNAVAGVNRALRAYPGPAKLQVGQAQNNANASSNQMQVDVRAGDPATLQVASDQVLAAVSTVKGLAQLKSNLVVSKPQYQLVPTDRLAASGLNIQTLAAIVAQSVNGQVATQANLAQGTMIVRVKLPPGTADTAASLASLPVPTALGIVPLSTIATIQEVTGPQTVNRVNGALDATITGTITANDTRAVQTSVTNALNGLRLPAGTSLSTGGVFAQLSTVLTQFALALLAAIGLVYLIMVATFRSLLKPLVLLVAIPFAATGAIIALVVTNTSLSLPGLIGILMLTGIVVTNAIVLLDLIEQYRDRGLSLHDAIIEGGRHRLRPILMTAFATMLALVPLAVIGGGGGIGGAFISRPLAIVVIGGLFTSTVLTLVLVPVLYSLVSRFASRRSTKDLDDLLDAAQERRFKPIGGRGSVLETTAKSGDEAGRTFSVSVLLEPEPGRPGDRAVLQRLASSGLSIAPVTGSAQFTITIANVAAESEAAAKHVAVSTIKGMLPREGYVISNPEVHVADGPVAAAPAQVSA